jgi:lipopolysaccharide cholinephosphotransferase
MRDIIRIKRTNQTRGKLILKILNVFLKLVPLRILEHYQEKLWDKYNRTSSMFVTCYFYKMLVGRDLYFPISLMYPSIEIDFEGRSFMIMNGYSDYLTLMYKDFMQLPPEEKRIYHFKGEILYDTDLHKN